MFNSFTDIDPAKYPMIAKLAAIPKGERERLEEFFLFLRDNDMLSTPHPYVAHVLARFYGIDIAALNKERDCACEEMHEATTR